MPWSSQGGGGGGGQGPWGQGSGGPQPPDLEELLRKGQERLKRVFPGGGGSARILIIVALVAVALWGLSGFYRVQPDQQGVVLRFGEWVKTTGPGLNYHLPNPIESVMTPSVTTVNRIEVGFRSVTGGRRSVGARDVIEESLMLTGDENIIDVDFTVLWRIGDAGKFLFNIAEPERTVRVVAESAMREVIGKTEIAQALSEGRLALEQDTRALMQRVLDDYGSGVVITEVKVQKSDPPSAVIDSYRDVQAARADRERLRNEAESYRNDIIPRARGEAEQLKQEAEAFREQVVAKATGDADRFLSVYNAYRLAKDVTVRRIYLETMEEVLGGINKIIIDSKGGQGVVPYLPLPEIQRRTTGGER